MVLRGLGILEDHPHISPIKKKPTTRQIRPLPPSTGWARSFEIGIHNGTTLSYTQQKTQKLIRQNIWIMYDHKGYLFAKISFSLTNHKLRGFTPKSRIFPSYVKIPHNFTNPPITNVLLLICKKNYYTVYLGDPACGHITLYQDTHRFPALQRCAGNLGGVM